VTNKVYLLSNTGGGTLTWTASKSASWLNLSAASGTLLGGASTNITVSLNANANTLSGGNYSDTISFVNTIDGNGDTTRDVTLGVTQLAVTPSTGLTSRGPVGGAVAPASTVYSLTHISPSVSLTWGAGTSVSWLTPSPATGVLSGNNGVGVTVSINANANSLSRGVYNGTVSFTNSVSE